MEGVGYYDAGYRRWFPYMWNEFRESQGYFWAGIWQPAPDQRCVAESLPEPEEITRVNTLWNKADPGRHANFQEVVERFGFGIADGRKEGS